MVRVRRRPWCASVCLEPLQLVSKLSPGVEEPGFYGVFRAPRDQGDLRKRPLLEVTEPDHLSVVGTKSFEHPALMLAAGLSVAAPVLAQTPTPYDGLKKTISVDLFQATEAVGDTVTAEGMTAMLVDALVRDGRFVVVERPALAGVEAEQALSAGSVNARVNTVDACKHKGGTVLTVSNLPMCRLPAPAAAPDRWTPVVPRPQEAR